MISYCCCYCCVQSGAATSSHCASSTALRGGRGSPRHRGVAVNRRDPGHTQRSTQSSQDRPTSQSTLPLQGAAEKSGPLIFFAVFSATVWDFNTKFYSFIY